MTRTEFLATSRSMGLDAAVFLAGALGIALAVIELWSAQA